MNAAAPPLFAAALAAAYLAAPGAARAQIVVYDAFDTPAGQATVRDDAADPSDSVWQAFTGTLISVAADDMRPDTRVLAVDGTKTYAGLETRFPTLSLDVGDTIKAELQIRLVKVERPVASVLRVTLAGSQPPGGIVALFGLDSKRSLAIGHDANGDGSGTDMKQLRSVPLPRPADDGTWHRLALQIKRTAEGRLAVNATLDDVTAAVEVTEAVHFVKDFTRLRLVAGNTTIQLRIDDVTVERTGP